MGACGSTPQMNPNEVDLTHFEMLKVQSMQSHLTFMHARSLARLLFTHSRHASYTYVARKQIHLCFSFYVMSFNQHQWN
jgi:hypothetical protein